MNIYNGCPSNICLLALTGLLRPHVNSVSVHIIITGFPEVQKYRIPNYITYFMYQNDFDVSGVRRRQEGRELCRGIRGFSILVYTYSIYYIVYNSIHPILLRNSHTAHNIHCITTTQQYCTIL